MYGNNFVCVCLFYYSHPPQSSKVEKKAINALDGGDTQMSLSGSVWETHNWQLGEEQISREKGTCLASQHILCSGTFWFLKNSLPDMILATCLFSFKGFERPSIHLFSYHSCGSLNTSCRRHTHISVSLCTRMHVQIRQSHSTPSPAIMELLLDTACQALLSHCSHTLRHSLNDSMSPSDVRK